MTKRSTAQVTTLYWCSRLSAHIMPQQCEVNRKRHAEASKRKRSSTGVAARLELDVRSNLWLRHCPTCPGVVIASGGAAKMFARDTASEEAAGAASKRRRSTFRTASNHTENSELRAGRIEPMKAGEMPLAEAAQRFGVGRVAARDLLRKHGVRGRRLGYGRGGIVVVPSKAVLELVKERARARRRTAAASRARGKARLAHRTP